MPDPTPTITEQQQAADASFVPFGDTADPDAPQLVETFGEYEAEYAAFRKGAAIFHAAHRGVIELAGSDRVDFLHRLLTNEVRHLDPGTSCRALLLDTRGRIIADLIVLAQADRTWLLCDRIDTARVAAELDALLFGEDVTIADRSPTTTTLAVHGPAAAKLIRQTTDVHILDLADSRHIEATWQGKPLTALRRDDTGAPGYQLIAPNETAATLYAALADAVGGLVPQVEDNTKRPIVGRGVGWLAYNTARIEAGAALFHIDFGADCLPHEAGLVEQAVSFTKGCYRGQEIVARMQNLGHPKRVLAGFRMADASDSQSNECEAPLPVAGVGVLDPDGTTVGAVTSSTLSPMLGGAAVGFAMVKWDWREVGRSVQIPAEGARRPARITAMRMLPSPS